MAKKQDTEVLAAEQAEVDAKAAWQAAQAAAKQAEETYYAACRASREARIKADAALPQCRMVSVKWRTDRVEDAGRVVVLKKTPGGTLVVRRVGDATGDYRFKWNKYTGRWTQAGRVGWTNDTRELRDVPAEYMTQEATA